MDASAVTGMWIRRGLRKTGLGLGLGIIKMRVANLMSLL
jgi:hypothetical protein